MKNVINTTQLLAEFQAWTDAYASNVSVFDVAHRVQGLVLHMLGGRSALPMVVRDQAINEAVWAVAIRAVSVRERVSFHSLAAAFFDAKLVADPKDQRALDTAKRCILTLRDINILSGDVQRDQFGQPFVAPSGAFEATRQGMMAEVIAEGGLRPRMMAVAPMPWVSVDEGLFPVDNKFKLCKDRIAVSQAVLDAVNKLQSTPLTVNPVGRRLAQLMLDNAHYFKLEESDKRLAQAIIDAPEGAVYMAVTLDFRGRMYYRGGLLTPQGQDLAKAALAFHEYKMLGEHGVLALKLAVANTHGAGKKSLNNRLLWVETHWDDLMDTKTFKDWIKKFGRKDAAQGFVALAELKRFKAFCDTGADPRLFPSNIIIHQDGSCNGYQHMAAMTRDETTAKFANLMAAGWDDTPFDAYFEVAEGALKYLKTQEAIDLLRKYMRNIAKGPTMVIGYGASRGTVLQSVIEFLADKGEDTSYAKEIADAMWKGIADRLPACMGLLNAIKSRAEKCGKSTFKWTTPDGLTVYHSYKDFSPYMMGAKGAQINTVTEADDVEHDHAKMCRALAPNFVHSLDAAHMRMVINSTDHPVVCIHDSYGTHAATYFEVGQIIRDKFAEIYDGEGAQKCLDSLTTGLNAPEIDFCGDFDVAEVEDAVYLFA